MPLRYKLNTNTIAKIKNNIRDIISTYQTTSFEKSDIGITQGGRHLVEQAYWPIDEALEYFVNQGAIKIEDNQIEVIKPDYFEANLDAFTLPISFSIDERIQASLSTMTALYAEIFDIENRLRFLLATKLEEKYSSNFINNLPQEIQNKIAHEKSKTKVYVLDVRNKELEFTDFANLISIVKSLSIPSSEPLRNKFLEKLDQIKEARDLVAHNTIVIPDEIEKIKEACSVVRKILTSIN